MIEDGLYARLQAVSGVTNLVSTRVRPWKAEQTDAMPYVTYLRTATERPRHMTGSAGYSWATFSIVGVDDDYSGAKNLANELRKALDHRVRATWGTDTVRASFVVADRDIPLLNQDGSDSGRYGVELTARICFNESTTPA